MFVGKEKGTEEHPYSVDRMQSAIEFRLSAGGGDGELGGRRSGQLSSSGGDAGNRPQRTSATPRSVFALSGGWIGCGIGCLLKVQAVEKPNQRRQ